MRASYVMKLCLFFSAYVAMTVLMHAPSTAAQGGTCRSALDCNAEQCYDCSCTDGKCHCGAGFSGDHCKTPFCYNRTDGCSGHGSCRQTLRNISCACDQFYVGDHCQTELCHLECKHGGTPVGDCSRCDGCKGAWGGKLCDKWNGDVPQSALMAKLYQIANASQKMLNDQARFDPICKQGRECVGWGVDGYTGKPTRFPIVRLTYDPSRTDKRFNGLSEPLEVVANRIVNPVWASVDGVQAFPRIEDFVQHVNTQYAGATPSPKGTSGVYSMGFTQVFKEFFQKDDDRALSVTRASKTLISMSLPVDPVTHTRKYDFDRHARDFAESLPPFYDTEDNKAQYRYFLENYGTSFVTSASLGGLVESYASWKSWITDSRLGGFTNAMLERNAQVDFVSKTGLPGPTSAHDKGYVRNRVLQPLFCRGGDSSKSCDASFSKWEKTIADLPVLLDYELAPVSDLVTDPTVKASLDQAVKEYISEKRSEWEKLDKCPVNCGPKGAGSCEKGESTCSCKYKGMIGRMCSGCAPMSVKATFTDILGKKSSAVGTVGCDGKAVTVWQGKGLCRSGALFRRSCSADVQAQCSRSSNGNLMAIVKQQDCNAPCNPSDLQSGFNDKQAQPPLVDRRLLSKRTLSGGSCFPPQLKCKGGKGSKANSGSVSTSSASVSVDINKVKNSHYRCSVLDKKKKMEKCQASVTCQFN